MSSTTLEPTPSRRGAHSGDPNNQATDRAGSCLSTGPGPSFPRVLSSEFIKFRTLLSTLILLGATIVVIVGVGAPAAWGIGQALQSSGANPQRAAALSAQADIAAPAPSPGSSFTQL